MSSTATAPQLTLFGGAPPITSSPPRTSKASGEPEEPHAPTCATALPSGALCGALAVVNEHARGRRTTGGWACARHAYAYMVACVSVRRVEGDMAVVVVHGWNSTTPVAIPVPDAWRVAMQTGTVWRAHAWLEAPGPELLAIEFLECLPPPDDDGLAPAPGTRHTILCPERTLGSMEAEDVEGDWRGVAQQRAIREKCAMGVYDVSVTTGQWSKQHHVKADGSIEF